jgi:hypothetical protein
MKRDQTKRRHFISLLACATAAWPLAAHAELRKVAHVGFLGASTEALERPLVDAFRQENYQRMAAAA